MISDRSDKDKFIKSHSDKIAYQMSGSDIDVIIGDYAKKYDITMAGSDIDVIIRHYAEKYDIRIIKNGTTKHYKDILNERHNKIAKNINSNVTELLSDLNCPDKIFISYLHYCSFDPSGTDFGFEFKMKTFDIYHVANPLNKYTTNLVDDIFGIKTCKDLMTDKYKLNVKIQKMNGEQKLFFNNQLKNTVIELGILNDFETTVNNLKHQLQLIISNKGLEQNECIDEVHQIQKSLNENEYVGYFYTNGWQNGCGHFEVLVIGRYKIIKPIIWPGISAMRSINKNMFPEMFSPEIHKDFFAEISDTDKNKAFHFCPQAGDTECGTLDIAYLKELLKNNAEQLIKLSLTFSCYIDSSTTPINLFIPSPRPLRYSQSSLYNKIFAAIMSPNHSTDDIYTDSGLKFKVKSLKMIFERSIEIAYEKNDITLAEQNTLLLKTLPSFISSWNKAYFESNAKRDKMYIPSDQGTAINGYLLFKSLRVQEIVTKDNENKANNDNVKFLL